MVAQTGKPQGQQVDFGPVTCTKVLRLRRQSNRFGTKEPIPPQRVLRKATRWTATKRSGFHLLLPLRNGCWGRFSSFLECCLPRCSCSLFLVFSLETTRQRIPSLPRQIRASVVPLKRAPSGGGGGEGLASDMTHRRSTWIYLRCLVAMEKRASFLGWLSLNGHPSNESGKNGRNPLGN